MKVQIGRTTRSIALLPSLNIMWIGHPNIVWVECDWLVFYVMFKMC